MAKYSKKPPLDRLREWVSAQGGQTAAALKIGVTQQCLGGILTGRRQVAALRTAVFIERATGIAPKDWL